MCIFMVVLFPGVLFFYIEMYITLVRKQYGVFFVPKLIVANEAFVLLQVIFGPMFSGKR